MKPARRAALWAPGSYRRQRLGDLARLLPLVGVALFFVPLLGANARMTGATGIWLFLCWAGLIAVAAWLARHLSPALGHEPPPEGEAEP